MRRHRCRRRKRQGKIIVITTVCLLMVMTAGYAAFSTNLNITAKGNILCNPITINELKEKVVTSGDGLYKDNYEAERYVYRGTNPNNYLKLGNDIYRIIAIEKDDTVKVIKNTLITQSFFDKPNARYKENTYCDSTFVKTYGCNIWGSKTTMLDEFGNHITQIQKTSSSTILYDLPEEEAYINTYLNNSWYNTLDINIQKYIVNHKFKVGHINISKNQNITTEINDEAKYLWEGKIGLINTIDYVKASTNSNCINLYSASKEGGGLCNQNNYLYKSANWYSFWTINPQMDNNTDVIDVIPSFGLDSPGASGNIFILPVFYLSSNIELCNEGTENNPYQIK